MSKLHQIHEEDLAELERTLPVIAQELAPHLSPRTRTMLRRLKDILSNVRWEYGPWTDVEVIGDDYLNTAGQE